jgi:Type II CAAX prenyl endopeptidase Rce1-like
MSRAASTGSAAAAAHRASSALSSYFKRSERPLQSLAFVTLLILIYEIGYRTTDSQLLAFTLLRSFFRMLGATGQFLPAFALIGILLAWHIARREDWTIDVRNLVFMAFESFLLAVPLLVLSAGLSRWGIHSPLAALHGNWTDNVVISIGAGVYEELIFRLIGLTLLHLLLVDILRMRPKPAAVLMVFLSGIMFSLYHYLGSESFAWRSCVFRTVAGMYFGAIFLCRGFGITAGSHAAYDLIVCTLGALS